VHTRTVYKSAGWKKSCSLTPPPGEGGPVCVGKTDLFGQKIRAVVPGFLRERKEGGEGVRTPPPPNRWGSGRGYPHLLLELFFCSRK